MYRTLCDNYVYIMSRGMEIMKLYTILRNERLNIPENVAQCDVFDIWISSIIPVMRKLVNHFLALSKFIK